MIYLIIYLIGVVVAWRVMIKIFKDAAKKENEMYDLACSIMAILLSVGSWIVVFFWASHKAMFWIINFFDGKKPPKWM